MSQRYRKAYEALGEERVQAPPPVRAEDDGSYKDGMFGTAEDAYWGLRATSNWVDLPGNFRYIRRLKKKEFNESVSQILMQLEPATTFDPAATWRAEQERVAEEAKAAAGGAAKEDKVKDSKKLKKIDKFREENAVKQAEKRLSAEVTRIRNAKDRLLSIVRDIKYPEARAIMLIQILKNAYDDYKKDSKNKNLLYEVLWSLDDVTLPTTPAPKPSGKMMVTDSGLVCDNLESMNKLIESARRVLTNEKDLVKLQLTKMSDRLPPLSRFSFGFRLDPWQKTVLTWIDQGKSVVISAPTSSGKTVLSSYVAVIFRSKIGKDQGEDGEEGETPAITAPEPAKVETVVIDGETVEVVEEEEEEEPSDAESEDEDVLSPEAAAIDARISEVELDAVELDRLRRAKFFEQRQTISERSASSGRATGHQKVLFVVPSEPLVWQIAAYFTKLMRVDGDKNTVVGIVTDQLTFSPVKTFNNMPQIVVGTPGALESALTKPRGLTGQDESRNKPAGNILAGGYDHFDWVIYDEVHALDGPEGASLQRLIRMMSCPFLALSATIGNAQQLKDWMVTVKNDQLDSVQCINVHPTGQATIPGEETVAPVVDFAKGDSSALRIELRNTMLEETRILNLPAGSSIAVMKQRLLEVWKDLVAEDTKAPEGKATMKLFVDAGVATRSGSSNIVDFSSSGLSLDTIASTGATIYVASSFKLSFINSSTCEKKSIVLSSFGTSVADLRQRIAQLWNLEDPDTAQIVFKGVSLANGSSVASYGMFVPTLRDSERTAYLRFFAVNECLGGSGRFINLQRFVWDPRSTNGQRLNPLSPLVGVPSVDALQAGILENSSLTFTPQDSFRVWEEMCKVYPMEAIEEVSPYRFFGARERITLQRTKEYEDVLKTQLRALSFSHPELTAKLLAAFSIQDPSREIDLCELLMELKKRELLPALPFHLSTFEAIALFQQVVAGLEVRQKAAAPTHYSDAAAELRRRRSANEAAMKSTGGNEKEAEERLRSGEIDADGVASTIDEHAPHPSFTFYTGAPIIDYELDLLIKEMEKYDGFEKTQAGGGGSASGAGKNLSVLRHALIRGLRRGVGLFINEVSFPSYRRMVQKLASTGRLGVVISDDSLAFGVNMPFRTCVFCGEMRGSLDEIMAQQMSGRAGRRGLDTQGNIIYAGLRIPLVRRLMIGTLSRITGERFDAKYEALYLQTVLSPRYTGISRTITVGGVSLKEFTSAANKDEKIPEDHKWSEEELSYSTTVSRRAMIDLGFLREVGVGIDEPAVSYAILAMVWEMRARMVEGIALGQLFPYLVHDLTRPVNAVSIKEKRSKYLEKIEPTIYDFFAMMSMFICRTPYNESEGGVKLSSLSFFATPARAEMLARWEALFAEQQAAIPERWAHLRSPVPPGTELDGTLFLCAVDRHYVHDLPQKRKQVMKEAIWNMGNVLKIMCNCAIVDDAYIRVSNFVFRNAFEKMRYLIAELIRAVINFDNVASAEFESRTAGRTAVTNAVMVAGVRRPKESFEWSDLESGSWASAVKSIAVECADLKTRLGGADPVAEEQFTECVFNYLAISSLDFPFLKAVLSGSDNVAIRSLAKSSFVSSAPEISDIEEGVTGTKLVSAVAWYCSVFKPSVIGKFPLFLKALYDDDILAEDAIIAWQNATLESIHPSLPSSYSSQRMGDILPVADSEFTEELLAKLKKSNAVFVEWLEQSEEEDDEEEDEEDDE